MLKQESLIMIELKQEKNIIHTIVTILGGISVALKRGIRNE